MNTDQLNMLEELGKCQMPIDKVALIMEMSHEDLLMLMSNKTTDAYKRYTKGKLLAEFEVRKSIYNLAVQNSSQAQELWLKLRDELKLIEA